MSNIIDNRIVKMEFDNAAFESKVRKTMMTLTNLDKLINSAAGATTLARSFARPFSLVSKLLPTDEIINTSSNIASKISNIFTSTFDKIGTIAKVGLGTLTAFGGTVTALAASGGMKRALNIEQAQFQLKSLMKDTYDWEKISEVLNYGVKDTAYGLDSAARAAAQLTASGIDMYNGMGNILRGISGVAAMTNRDYDEVAHIFTTMAGNGKLMTIQLRQLSTYGLNAAATLRDYFNTVEDGANYTEADIRDMVSDGKISFEQFAAAMDSAFGEHAKKANETFTGAMSNIKAALSRVGAEFATPYLNNMRDIFNDLIPFVNFIKNSIGPIVTEFSTAFVNLKNSIHSFIEPFVALETIEEEGTGVVHTVDRAAESVTFLKATLTELISILNTIKSAFKESFATAKNGIFSYLGLDKAPVGYQFLHKLFDEISLFNNNVVQKIDFGRFFDALLGPVWTEAETLKQIFDTIVAGTGDVDIAGAFNGFIDVVETVCRVIEAAITIWNRFINNSIEIAIPIIKDLASLLHYFSEVFSSIFLREDFIPLEDSILDFLDGFKTMVMDFYGFIRSIILGASTLLPSVDAIKSGIDTLGASAKQLGIFLSDTFGPLSESISGSLFEYISNAIKGLVGELDILFDTLARSKVVQNFIDTLKGARLVDLVSVLNTTGLAVALTHLHQVLKPLKMDFSALSGTAKAFSISNILGITPVIKELQLTLAEVQGAIKSKVILNIAEAIAAMAGALLLLSSIEPGDLLKSIVALEVIGTTLSSLTATASTSFSAMNPVALLATVAVFSTMSTAFLKLAFSMKILSTMDTESLLPALAGMGAVVASMSAIILLLGHLPEGTVLQGSATLKAIGVAFLLLAVSTKILSSIPVEQLRPAVLGMLSIVIALTVLIAVLGAMSDSSVAIMRSANMFASLGGTFLLIAASMKLLSTIKLGQGLENAILALTAIVIGLSSLMVVLSEIPAATVTASMAMFLSLSLLFAVIAGSLKLLSTMSLDQSVIAVGSLIAIIAAISGAMVALNKFGGAGNIGAISQILILAEAFGILSVALKILSTISILQGISGLLILAGALTVIGIAAKVLPINKLSALAPVLLQISLSSLALGAAVALASIGILTLTLAIVELCTFISQNGGEFIRSLGVMGVAVAEFVLNLATTIALNAAKFTAAAVVLILALLDGLTQTLPRLIEFGIFAIESLLIGIANGMGRIVYAGLMIVTNFILGIAAGIGDLISAGVQLVIMFIMGVADAFRTNRHMLENAITDVMNTIGMAFLEGLASIVEGIPVFGADWAKTLRDQASVMEAAADDASQAVWDEFNEKHDDVISGTEATMSDAANAITDGTPALEDASGSAGQSASDSFLASFGLDKSILGEMTLSSDTIEQYAPILADKTGQSAEDITAAWKSHIGGMSDATAEVSQDVGEQLSDNVPSGIDEHAADEKAGSLVVNATTTMANNTGKSEEAGKGLVTGLISGIDSLSHLAIERGKKLGEDTAQSVKDGAQVESPSKITTSAGRYITMGVIVGMRSLEQEAVSTAEGIGLNTANAMTGMSQLIDSIDWDAHPTISPVFDGSEALRGLREFNSMIPQENIRAAGMMGYYSGGRALGISSNSSQQTNNTFNITLDWEAGMDANAMVMALGNALRSQSLMYA